MRRLNEKLRKEIYEEKLFWTELVGRPVEQLFEDYKETFPKKGDGEGNVGEGNDDEGNDEEESSRCVDLLCIMTLTHTSQVCLNSFPAIFCLHAIRTATEIPWTTSSNASLMNSA